MNKDNGLRLRRDLHKALEEILGLVLRIAANSVAENTQLVVDHREL